MALEGGMGSDWGDSYSNNRCCHASPPLVSARQQEQAVIAPLREKTNGEDALCLSTTSTLPTGNATATATAMCRAGAKQARQVAAAVGG